MGAPVLAVTMLTSAAMLTACGSTSPGGGGASSSSSSSAPGQPGGQSVTGKIPDKPCSFVSGSDAGAILGTPVQEPTVGDKKDRCQYAAVAEETHKKAEIVFYVDDGTLYDSVAQTKSIPMAPVKGVGDKVVCLFTGNSPYGTAELTTLVKAKGLTVGVVTDGTGTSCDEAKALALKALSQL